MAQKGFSVGTRPEARALLQASDIVLTKSDGLVFHIVCIIDGESSPTRHFALDRTEIDRIGQACLKYTGRINRTRMPVVIQLVEIGPRPLQPADRERLRLLKRRSIFSKVHIQAWAIDTGQRTVWSNVPFNGLMSGRRFIERLLREPRIVGPAAARPPAATVDIQGSMLVTWLLLAVLALVFAVEQIAAVQPATGLLKPSIRTLIALGGLNRHLVLEQGEWYRLLSATALHGDMLHLVFNGIALFFAGAVLERLVGRAWFLAIYLIGGIAGALMSLAINPPNLVSVGASGAIMGLLAAACVTSFRLPSGSQRVQVQVGLLRILVPSLIPLASGASGQHVDFAAHFGGTVGGTIMGLLMLGIWPRERRLPGLRAIAMALSLAGAVAFAATLWPLSQRYQTEALAGQLIPRELLPKTDAEARTRSAELAQRYPRDPRARLFRATSLLQAHDAAGGERELRAGLSESEILRTQFEPNLEWRLRTVLALVLVDRGQRDEARSIAQPVCPEPKAGTMREALQKYQLCP